MKKLLIDLKLMESRVSEQRDIGDCIELSNLHRAISEFLSSQEEPIEGDYLDESGVLEQ